VTIREGDTTRVRLRLPDAAAIVRSLCGAAVRDTLPGAIVGRVTDATTGRAVTGRNVVVAWSRLVVVQDGLALGMRGPWRATAVASDGDGWYLACGLPAKTPIRVRSVPAYDKSWEETAKRLSQPDLRLPPDAREIRVEYGDAMGRVDLEVHRPAVQGFRARVVDEAARDALAGPEVTLLAADSTEIVRTTAGPDGSFTLDVAPGRYILRIRHSGYETLLVSVTLEEGRSTLPALVLRTAAIPLDPVVVDVDRGNIGLGGVEKSARPVNLLAGERLARLESSGVAFTTAIRDLGAGLRLSDVLVNGRSYTCIASARSGPGIGGGGCPMVAIIVDGVDTGLDGAEALRYVRGLHVAEFESIEFLTQHDAGVRYGTRAAERGALLLWTRGRGPHQSSTRGGTEARGAAWHRRLL
jgi:hypothetical protein